AGATTIAGISGLQAALDSKASTSHTHAAGDITSGTLVLDRLPVGSSFRVYYDGTSWKYGGNTITARPTSRTDLIMICVNEANSDVPSFAIENDILERVG
ncbi:MAG TPA: hypothetical protein PKC04_00175, partial [Candidatus Nanoperiomorbaceae bacterium]|nr:hypothetical protein [Candidatus Nanoperiomorbaceae bacterium]